MSKELDAAVAKALGYTHHGAVGVFKPEHASTPETPWCRSAVNDWWKDPTGAWLCGPCHGFPYAYSTDWALGGPIIESERIWLTAMPGGVWAAEISGPQGDPLINPNPKPGEPGHVKASECGPTPLIAAMRAFVASKR